MGGGESRAYPPAPRPRIGRTLSHPHPKTGLLPLSAPGWRRDGRAACQLHASHTPRRYRLFRTGALKPSCSCAHLSTHHPLWDSPPSDMTGGPALKGPILCQRPSFVSTSPNLISRPPAPQGQGLPLRRPVSLLPMSRAQTSSLPGLPGDTQGSGRLSPPQPHPSQPGWGPTSGQAPRGSVAWFMRKPAARPP